MSTVTKQVKIKTGEEQEPVAHLWLWVVFPGLKPVPHSLPIPFIAQCLAESQRTLAPVLPLDGPKSPTMPKDPQSLLPSQPLPPDTVSQQRGSWVNPSHHGCQAKVGPLCHSRGGGNGVTGKVSRAGGSPRRLHNKKICTQRIVPATCKTRKPLLQVDFCR